LTRSASTPKRSTSSQGASKTSSHHPRLTCRLTKRLTCSGPHDRLRDHDRGHAGAAASTSTKSTQSEPSSRVARPGAPNSSLSPSQTASSHIRSVGSPTPGDGERSSPARISPRPRKTTLQTRRLGADTSATRALACQVARLATRRPQTPAPRRSRPRRPRDRARRRRASPNQDTAAGHPPGRPLVNPREHERTRHPPVVVGGGQPH
jgi:hypothetical protein